MGGGEVEIWISIKYCKDTGYLTEALRSRDSVKSYLSEALWSRGTECYLTEALRSRGSVKKLPNRGALGRRGPEGGRREGLLCQGEAPRALARGSGLRKGVLGVQKLSQLRLEAGRAYEMKAGKLPILMQVKSAFSRRVRRLLSATSFISSYDHTMHRFLLGLLHCGAAHLFWTNSLLRLYYGAAHLLSKDLVKKVDIPRQCL